MKMYRAKTKDAADKLVASDGVPFVMDPDYWLNSQLSPAKYYRRIAYNGVHYQIDYDTGDLVRSDCYELYTKFYKVDRPKIAEEENEQ